MFNEIIYLTFFSLIIFCISEIIIQRYVRSVQKNFPWLISSKDENPILSKTGLSKFIPHGYDSELGWVRKPFTSNNEKGKNSEITWNINEKGARLNPSFENLDSKISCYGDSFTFSRQVNDDETWPHHLSGLTNSNVQNFGVGNYGLDQSLLRLKREFPKNPTKFVIMGVVPETICRILSMWKHYYEYGNTFAFKPKFTIENDQLIQISNPINESSKFQEYKKYIDFIKKNDYFYKEKFVKEKISFPYCITILKNFKRNFGIIYWQNKIENYKKNNRDFSKIKWKPMKIIMDINMSWKVKLYAEKNPSKLLKMILIEYANYAKKMNFVPIFTFLPQKDDLMFIKSHYNFLQDFQKELNSIEGLKVVDIIDDLLLEDQLDPLFSDNNDYGGHYSNQGNKIISELIFKKFEFSF